ncbi:hypothetical protein FEM48_Zijuj10G0090600 [Ziziphus jujuba var. spinosa]|uniref:DUF155 domain-containing protein n=2 Tax=fabids TaxID=91835 RepID=A0A978UMH1_ZIZJJ|nr:hypothetical protein FEM48_Zijuj10G0090600 [Ziziphus jujuba var. spinosa]
MGRWRPASFLLHHITTAAKSLALNPSFSSKPLHLSNRSRPTYHFLSLRRFSALPSRVPVDTDEFDSEDPHSCQNYGFGVQEDEDTGKIPVKAYFLCTRFVISVLSINSHVGWNFSLIYPFSSVSFCIHRFGSINLKSMQADNITYVLPPTSRSSNYIALRYCDTRSETTGRGVKKKMNRCRYMVVFQYGSAVLFNIDDHEIDSYLEVVRRYASGLLPEMRKDDYAVKEKPLLVQDMQGGPDYIVLKTLDTDSIRIIGSVLGQSIALDYFVSQVDGMVEEFADINRGMEKTGTFTMDKKKLLQLVGKANSNLADVILKVGLFERSEIAWRDAKYAQIYEYLREEYEVAQRFGNLDFKLKFVEVLLPRQAFLMHMLDMVPAKL